MASPSSIEENETTTHIIHAANNSTIQNTSNESNNHAPITDGDSTLGLKSNNYNDEDDSLKSYHTIGIVLSIMLVCVTFTSMVVLRLFAVFSGNFESIAPESVQIFLLIVQTITFTMLSGILLYIVINTCRLGNAETKKINCSPFKTDWRSQCETVRRSLSNVDIVLLLLFCAGGCLYLGFTANNQRKCISVLPSCTWLDLRLANSVVSIPVVVLQMILLVGMVCQRENTSKVFPHNLSRALRMILIILICISNLFLWINLLMEAFWEHLVDFIAVQSSARPCRTGNITDTFCYNLHWQQTPKEHMTFPFVLENCLFSISLIWHALMHSGSDTDHGGSERTSPSTEHSTNRDTMDDTLLPEPEIDGPVNSHSTNYQSTDTNRETIDDALLLEHEIGVPVNIHSATYQSTEHTDREITDATPLLETETVQSNPNCSQSTAQFVDNRVCSKLVICVVFILLCVGFIGFTFCVRLMSLDKHLLLGYDTCVIIFLVLGDCIPTCRICMQAYSDTKRQSNKSQKAKVSLNKFVYLTCVAMSYFYFILGFFAGVVITSTEENAWMLILKNVVLIFLLTLQSGTLLYIDRNGVQVDNNSGDMFIVVSILAGANFVIWLADEIFFSELKLRPVHTAAFGEGAWYCIWHLVYPFRTFLRIYSFEILIKFRSDIKRIYCSIYKQADVKCHTYS